MNTDYLKNLNELSLKRENSKHYIPLSSKEEADMLDSIGENSLSDLFKHIPSSIKLSHPPAIEEIENIEDLANAIEKISLKNNIAKVSFLGDTLPVWKVESIADEVSKIRGLSTAYTPYQPERSQGTLISHWIYQNAMRALTGFEAINASLYDRASAIFEAASSCSRLSKKSKILISESLFESDIEVVKTFTNNTSLEVMIAPCDGETSLTDLITLREILENNKDTLACFIYPQVNRFGCLENVDSLNDFAKEFSLKTVAVIDPFLNAFGGLKEPIYFGKTGVDFICGEGQHLYSYPNFGGPGLGVFGVRFNENVKNDIRQAAGRFVGSAKDEAGRDAFSMILSTREQHIRKEKATSNICSNEAFMATLAGACVLQKSSDGFKKSLELARSLAKIAFEKISTLAGFEYIFGNTPFFNEFTISCPSNVHNMIADAAKKGIHIGVNVPFENKELLKISFSDINSESDIDTLVAFLKNYALGESSAKIAPEISKDYLRKTELNLPKISFEELKNYYIKLGELNVSPDDSCYPLGSCTMKYNPHINDILASLDSFTKAHPQAPESDVQGSLEILWTFAEYIKKISNLDAVALQPVAGAQGEHCALKMFQAYHKDNSKGARDIMLIPSSAHGTNFASAAVAGYEQSNIIYLKTDSNAQLSIEDLKEKISLYGDRVAGIMITNPNTSGIVEARFEEISKLIHEIGGLVYMDGANYNAIAGHLNLKKMGVDAMHNNLHKTWSIAHGGGGPGDGLVVVDEKLSDYIPSYIIENNNGIFSVKKPAKSIGSLHRNFGNVAHKIRALAYMMRLGGEGIQRMSAVAVLASRYLFESLKKTWDSLPAGCENEPRMHEFILTLSEDDFAAYQSASVAKAAATARTGKLFLDYGFHAPTVAFPEIYGLMIEPTESYTQSELDRFKDAIISMHKIIKNHPEKAAQSPRFTPIDRIDEATANRNPQLSLAVFDSLPKIPQNRKSPKELNALSIEQIEKLIIES